MSTRKNEKTTGKKNGGDQHEEPQTGRVHTIAKPRPTPVTGAPKDKPLAVIVSEDAPAETAKAPTKTPKKVKAPTTDVVQPQLNDGAEIVVFAFRMTRAERDELHAATGSARASRFVRAIVLAGARGDLKAVQEIVEEVQASRK